MCAACVCCFAFCVLFGILRALRFACFSGLDCHESVRSLADPGPPLNAHIVSPHLAVELPFFWRELGLQLGADPDDQLVALEQDSKMYKRIKELFSTSFPSDDQPFVVAIKAIINTYVLVKYCIKKGELERINPDEGAHEMYLWHGVGDNAALKGITAEGFKTRRGRMGYCHYGAGIYFATDPKLAHYFTSTSEEPGERRMILLRVLCGKTGTKRSILDPEVRTRVCVCVSECCVCAC